MIEHKIFCQLLWFKKILRFGLSLRFFWNCKFNTRFNGLIITRVRPIWGTRLTLQDYDCVYCLVCLKSVTGNKRQLIEWEGVNPLGIDGIWSLKGWENMSFCVLLWIFHIDKICTGECKVLLWSRSIYPTYSIWC